MLFFIFYTMPQEEIQLTAARCLTKRGWLYATTLMAWVKPVQEEPPVNAQIEGHVCRTWAVFDVKEWQVVRRSNFPIAQNTVAF